MKKGVNAEFYDDSQHIASYVSAEYGMYKQNDKKVILKRKVRVLNIKGEKLETELLTWDQATSKIYTDQYVIITTGTETITGTGMTANQNFTSWTITHPSGTIQK